MREIMDAMSLSHPATDGDLKKGTQIGASESAYNAVFCISERSPCGIMLVMPTTDGCKRTSRLRLQPAIDATPTLAAKFSAAKSRDGANTVLMKEFPGGYLLLTGANSGPGLRHMPVRVLLMDEIDAYPDDVDGEGDPCAVAAKRTDNFYRAKRFAFSSPKLKGSSRIDRRYNRGTRAHYYVPCPHCAHLQWLKWAQIRWDMEQRRELACTGCGAVTELHDETPAACPHCAAAVGREAIKTRAGEDVAEAWYECEACGERIDEYHKTVMMEEWPAGRARHIHEQPGIGEVLADDDPHPHAVWAWVAGQMRRFLPRFRRPLTWEVSALYSPLGWFSWRSAVLQLIEAQKGGYSEETGESLLQVFHNTVLGEAYEPPGEQPQQAVLKLRAESYSLGQVPAGGLLLATGVDVQGDRLEVKVKAYGRFEESWVVDYQRIYYAPGEKKPDAKVWAALIAMRDKAYPHAGGQTLRAAAMAVDSGYLTQEVYDFCRTWAHKHVIAIRGVPGRGKPILGRPAPVDISHEGKRIPNGVRLFTVGVDTAKERVFTRLAIDKPGPGYMHFPRDLADEYYDGLTAEKLIRRRVKGVEKLEYHKTRERNEPLDLENYCYAAALYAGVQRMNWDQMEQVINPGQRDLFVEAAQAAARAGKTATPPVMAPAFVAAPLPVAVPPAVQTSARRTDWLPRRDNWLRG